MFIQAICNQGTWQGHNDSYGNYDGWMDGLVSKQTGGYATYQKIKK